jgi:hypothetical protein
MCYIYYFKKITAMLGINFREESTFKSSFFTDCFRPPEANSMCFWVTIMLEFMYVPPRMLYGAPIW